tara:strand:+ start:3353 stop:3649 length:297 start_codon:yes stop_codon:yes gene_type:complete
MDTFIGIIESIDRLDYVSLGASISLMGSVFWFMPYSRRFRVMEQKHSALAQEWRSRGHTKNADRLERMHAIKNIRLPIYGKIMVIVGLMVVGAASVGL